MKKINTILAAVGALLMLTVTGANSVEFKAGVSANAMAAYANATEQVKDSGRTTNEEAILAASYLSVFAEVSSDGIMGLGIGLSYAPDVVELNQETRQIANCKDNLAGTGACTAETSVAGIDASGGVQKVDGKISDLVSLYLTLPVSDTGAYVKAGVMQATLTTQESLATGSSYKNVDLTGTHVGGGYEGSLGDMAFWRAEGNFQMWEDISVNGTEAGGSGTTNKITAELGSITGSLSVGMKF